MEMHNLPGKAQSDSRSFLLGRVEWNEYLLQVLFGNSTAIVSHSYDLLMPVAFSSDIDTLF